LNYLVLHIDKDFISGTVCVGNATSVPITQGNDNMLWLYFFNNPHQDRVSFGRENRIHFNERKVNYYGSFTEKITDDTETFTIRGIKKPIIELLEYSDLIKLVQSSYELVTRESSVSIPTLITFSLSLSDLSKQTLVDYLSKKGFDINSYTIPLAELTCYSLHSKKKFSIANGSTVIFLSATNATLHIMKMVFSENYFMIDGEIESFKGKGIDPRKRALVKFVVNELNKSTGALSSSDEIEDECVRKEQQADEWLKRLDAQSSNRPISINESLSVMQSTKLQVLVRKEHIDKDTGHYVNELADIFDFFKSKHFMGDVAGLFLLGDCFLSSLVNKKFKNYVSEDKLFVFGNKDIPEILSSYPKIDFKRYIDQESRIKALAEAEELKQIEQRALEDRLRKEQEMLQNKEASEKQAELNKIEAQQKYERAVELELEGKLEDAKVNIEQALLLDKTSKQISLHHANLLEKIRIRNEKNDLYKSYLSKAEKYRDQNKLEKALEEFEAAKLVFENAEIVKSIIEIKRLIKESEKQKEQVAEMISEGNSLLAENKFDEAESIFNDILGLDNTHKEAIKLLAKIPSLKKQYQAELEKQQKLLQFEANIELANSLFECNKYQEAKEKYQLAAAIQKDKKATEGIEVCNAKLKEIEDTYTELLFKANQSESKEELKQAIDYVNQAIALKGNNEDLYKKVKKLAFDLQFKTDEAASKSKAPFVKVVNKSKEKENTPAKTTEDDAFAFANKKAVTQISINKEAKKNDDFLTKSAKNGAVKSEDEFNFLEKTNKSKRVNGNNENDFLNSKKSTKTNDDFLFNETKESINRKNDSQKKNNKNPKESKGKFDW
jgi:tetratricopeptide (TPR) repeat protein